MQFIPGDAGPLDTAMPSALPKVAAAFGLGTVTRVEIIAEGLMNRNWRMTTPTGVWAVKQILDVSPEAARRQHRTAAALAKLGLPVPTPATVGDDSVAVVDGSPYAVLPWAAGVHRAGTTLTVPEAAALGELLARLHLALAEVLPDAPDRVVVPVTDLATALARIDRYLRLIAEQPALNDFDRYARTELHHRRGKPWPVCVPLRQCLQHRVATHTATSST